MILGVDHLAWNVTDTDEAVANLELRGFECVFLERDVPNHPSKKALVNTYYPVHDLGLFRPKHGGIPIELINQGSTLNRKKGPYSYKDDLIVLRVSNADEECRFLKEAFRFRGDEDNLTLSSPVPYWSCRIQVIEDKTCRTYPLDTRGYACLALITNDLVGDLQTAVVAGATDCTDIFEMNLNKRQLSVVLFRSPKGVIYELIQTNLTR